MDRTREVIEKELRDFMIARLGELNAVTAMSVKDVDVRFDRDDFGGGRSEYYLAAIDINYHSHYKSEE